MEPPEELIPRLLRQAGQLKDRGRFNEAVAAVDEAIGFLERMGPAGAWVHLRALHMKAQTLHAQGRFGRAEPLYRQLIDGLGRFGQETVEMATALNDLGLLEMAARATRDRSYARRSDQT